MHRAFHDLRGTPAPVDRVVCASMAAEGTGIFEQMQVMRADALRHNRALDVHEAVMFQSGWFVFWAEGPAASIDALLDRLGKSKRHHSIRMLHRSAGARHLLTAWSMLVQTTTEPAEQFDARVQEARLRFEQGRQASPTSTMRRLSTPLQIGVPGAAGPDTPFHRVGVCAAQGNVSFELVRWLAAQHKTSFVMRRAAGEEGGDGASDYVEFLHGGYPCRVVAVARQTLLQSMCRAFMPDWSSLLLLLSGDDQRDDALMDRLRLACVGLPAFPRLIGFAPAVTTHRRMATAAALDGLDYFDACETDPRNFAAIWAAFAPLLSGMGPPAATDWT